MLGGSGWLYTGLKTLQRHALLQVKRPLPGLCGQGGADFFKFFFFKKVELRGVLEFRICFSDDEMSGGTQRWA